MITENIIIADIETETLGPRPDPEKDILKFVGFMDVDGNKVMFDASEKEKIQYGLTGKANFIVGHNFKAYDAVVLKRYGYKIYPSIIIDTYEIVKKRAKSMMYLDLNQGQFSLRYLAHHFGLPSLKGDIDYDIFKQKSFTDAELEEIKIYLDGDLDTSYHLFKYLYEFFEGFKDFMSEENLRRMSWLTSGAGGTAYKAVCNMAGLVEEYEDGDEDTEIQYQGAFVALPEVDMADGDMYCIDFASLYPHMFMAGNLYSPSKEGWHGSGMFESIEDNPEDGITGTYATTPGKIEVTIRKLYNMRVEVKRSMKSMTYGTQDYKTADAKQLAIKIIINTIYGISGSKIFKNVFSLTTAADCTAMARMAIKHARKRLTDAGFVCVYTDTDSVYIIDPMKNPEYVQFIADSITTEQIESSNIEISSHYFEIEDRIKRMYFFRNDDGDYIKKLYLYVKANDKITLKGLPLVRGTCSEVSRQVYESDLLPRILDGKEVVRDMQTIWDAVMKHITIENISKRFRVNDVEAYKNATSIQASISAMYGAGEHFLIPNHVVGAGKGIKYAKLEELEALGDPLEYVDVRKYINELRHFITPGYERKKMAFVGEKHECKSFTLDFEDDRERMAQRVTCRSCGRKYARIKTKKSEKWSYYAKNETV